MSHESFSLKASLEVQLAGEGGRYEGSNVLDICVVEVELVQEMVQAVRGAVDGDSEAAGARRLAGAAGWVRNFD